MFTILKKPLKRSSPKNSSRVSGQDRKKNRPLTEPNRLQDLESSTRSQTWEKNKY